MHAVDDALAGYGTHFLMNERETPALSLEETMASCGWDRGDIVVVRRGWRSEYGQWEEAEWVSGEVGKCFSIIPSWNRVSCCCCCPSTHLDNLNEAGMGGRLWSALLCGSGGGL